MKEIESILEPRGAKELVEAYIYIYVMDLSGY